MKVILSVFIGILLTTVMVLAVCDQSQKVLDRYNGGHITYDGVEYNDLCDSFTRIQHEVSCSFDTIEIMYDSYLCEYGCADGLSCKSASVNIIELWLKGEATSQEVFNVLINQ